MGIKQIIVDGKTVRCADNIHNPAALIEGHADTGVFKGVFPRAAIYPTDKDYSVEINGHLLEMEFKKDGAEVPQGQQIRIDNIMCSQQQTVIVAWHKGPLVDMDITHFKMYCAAWLGHKVLEGSGLDRLLAASRWWGIEADKRHYCKRFPFRDSA